MASGTGQGRLTTHILDTAHGRPAAGVTVELFRVEREGSGESRKLLRSAQTNGDGRCDQPLLAGNELAPGVYELLFHVGAYFTGAGATAGSIPFLDVVPVRFGRPPEVMVIRLGGVAVAGKMA